MHYYYKRDWFDGAEKSIWYETSVELSKKDFEKYTVEKCSWIKYYLAKRTNFLWRIKCQLNDLRL